MGSGYETTLLSRDCHIPTRSHLAPIAPIKLLSFSRHGVLSISDRYYQASMREMGEMVRKLLLLRISQVSSFFDRLSLLELEGSLHTLGINQLSTRLLSFFSWGAISAVDPSAVDCFAMLPTLRSIGTPLTALIHLVLVCVRSRFENRAIAAIAT